VWLLLLADWGKESGKRERKEMTRGRKEVGWEMEKCFTCQAFFSLTFTVIVNADNDKCVHRACISALHISHVGWGLCQRKKGKLIFIREFEFPEIFNFHRDISTKYFGGI
jgi:hypothetical protein